MNSVSSFVILFLMGTFRSRLSLQSENAALRHQLSAYRRAQRRPGIAPGDRLLWSLLARLWHGWREALFFVQPRTVILWQRKRFRDHWRNLSRGHCLGRPAISPELRALIRRMWQANPTWGSPRIVGELQKLGIEIAKSTVEKYRPKLRKPPSLSWRTFLKQHMPRHRGDRLLHRSHNAASCLVRACCFGSRSPSHNLLQYDGAPDR